MSIEYGSSMRNSQNCIKNTPAKVSKSLVNSRLPARRGLFQRQEHENAELYTKRRAVILSVKFAVLISYVCALSGILLWNEQVA